LYYRHGQTLLLLLLLFDYAQFLFTCAYFCKCFWRYLYVKDDQQDGRKPSPIACHYTPNLSNKFCLVAAENNTAVNDADAKPMTSVNASTWRIGYAAAAAAASPVAVDDSV